ncbi:hypothetical protein GW17_00015910 [Ensete ventricosum]|nr:hypothetical protein GW17_00015910 [Ensete ventricosum]
MRRRYEGRGSSRTEEERQRRVPGDATEGRRGISAPAAVPPLDRIISDINISSNRVDLGSRSVHSTVKSNRGLNEEKDEGRHKCKDCSFNITFKEKTRRTSTEKKDDLERRPGDTVKNDDSARCG